MKTYYLHRPKAGVKPGTTSYDLVSSRGDFLTKYAAQSLKDDADIRDAGLVYTVGFTESELGGESWGGKTGATPDGGIWRSLVTNQMLAMIEHKKQGRTGNAFERWYANQDYFYYNGGVRSLTFLAGEGVNPGCTMYREVVSKLLREGKKTNAINRDFPTGSTFYTSDEGFKCDELKLIIKRWLLQPFV